MSQSKRMKNAVEKLKEKGVTKRSIAERFCKVSNSPDFMNEDKIKKYCYVVKSIPEEVLKLFHSEYNINPDYIKEKSNRMFDEAGVKLSLLTELVYDWQIVEYEGDERFLHLQLDRNFYQYLLELGHCEILQESGMQSYDEEEAKIREKYNKSEEDITDFILLPRNRFVEIVEAHEGDRKGFEEFINTFLYKDYVNDKNAIRSPKHKKNCLEETSLDD